MLLLTDEDDDALIGEEDISDNEISNIDIHNNVVVDGITVFSAKTTTTDLELLPKETLSVVDDEPEFYITGKSFYTYI